MGAVDELIELERRGWKALSTDGEAATAFYEEVLDRQVVMLLPGGMRLDDRAAIVSSMGGQPWQSFQLEDVSAHQPTPELGLVTYGVRAWREGSDEYSALISSTYVRREAGWRMVAHQQTPR